MKSAQTLILIVLPLLAVSLAACAGGAPVERRWEGVVMQVPPQGFELREEETDGDTTVQEYTLAEETLDSWSELVTIQTFHGQTDVSPAAYLERLASAFRRICNKIVVLPLEIDTTLAGHPYALFEITCINPSEEARKRGGSLDLRNFEYGVFKAIQGRLSLHVIQRIWHGDAIDPARPPASAAEREAWLRHMRSVDLCDPGEPGSGCSKGG